MEGALAYRNGARGANESRLTKDNCLSPRGALRNASIGKTAAGKNYTPGTLTRLRLTDNERASPRARYLLEVVTVVNSGVRRVLVGKHAG